MKEVKIKLYELPKVLSSFISDGGRSFGSISGGGG